MDLSSPSEFRDYPKYTSVLESDDIVADDLGDLQFELESLLIDAIQRKEIFEENLILLNNINQDKEKRPSEKLESVVGEKRSLPETKPTKKWKDNSGKLNPVVNMGKPKSKKDQEQEISEKRSMPCTPTEIKTPKKVEDIIGKAHSTSSVVTPKSKKDQLNRIFDVEVPMDGPKIKTESPSRFWTFIESYCSEITQDDIKMLQNWVQSHSEDLNYQTIPPLGKHYTYKWMQEDIKEEKVEGSKSVERRKGLNNNSVLNSTDGEKLLKKVEKNYDSDDSCQLGPLTQRLVSCLVEKNLMTSIDDIMTENYKDTTAPTRKLFVKSLNLGNTLELEKRIRKELVDQGLLESENTDIGDPDDEVLAEIKNLQASLKSVCEYNSNCKKNLLQLAKLEIEKQEIKKEIQKADAEVLELHRKVVDQQNVSNEHATFLLKQREILIKKLQEMDAT